MQPTWATASFQLIACETQQFLALAEGISDEHWMQPSSCAGWSVAELVAHLAFGASYYAAAVADALDGNPRPLWSGGGEEAHAQQRTLIGATPREGAAVVRDASERLDAVLGRANPADLSVEAWHMRGPRPIWMYAAMRVYELGLHRWDLAKSFGTEVLPNRDVALLLVDLLVDRLMPQTLDAKAAAGLSADICLAFGSEERALRFESGTVRGLPLGEASPRVTLAMEPQEFVLGITGRHQWPAGARISGDVDLGRRLARLFGVW
jgi:uncharacterized protein (TIGR03083 family)